jgi:ABC-type branched-subunit amino acid transport system substrate-binding protein
LFPDIFPSPDQLPGTYAHSRLQRGRRRLGLFAVGVVAAALVGLGPAGCGGGSDAPVAEYRVRPVRTVHLVVPLGLAGGDAKDMRAAVEMALADGGDAISGVRIRLRTNNTSGPTGAESAARAVDAAETAAIDPYSLAVIGSITSNGMRQMAPILNRAGLLHVSVTATAVDLTRRDDGLPTPPTAVAPTGVRTIVRVVPNDLVQSKALATYMQDEGVRSVSVVSDPTFYGQGLGLNVVNAARDAGLIIDGPPITITPQNAAEVGRAIGVRHKDDNSRWALMIATNDPVTALRVARAAGASDEQMVIFAPDALALRGFHGRLGRLESRTYLTSYLLPLAAYGPRGKQAHDRLAKRLGHSPSSLVLFAYEGMALTLDAIRTANETPGFVDMPIDRERDLVRDAALATDTRDSVIGTYSIDIFGDTTTTLFGGYRVEDGKLVRGRSFATGSVS